MKVSERIWLAVGIAVYLYLTFVVFHPIGDAYMCVLDNGTVCAQFQHVKYQEINYYDLKTWWMFALVLHSVVSAIAALIIILFTIRQIIKLVSLVDKLDTAPVKSSKPASDPQPTGVYDQSISDTE